MSGSGGSGGSRRFGDGKVPPGKHIKKEPKDKHRRPKSSGKASPKLHQEEHQREQQGLSEEEGDAAHDVQRVPQKHTRTHRGKHVETQPPMFDTEDVELAEDVMQFNRQDRVQQRRQSQLRRSRESQVTSLLAKVLPFMSFLVVS